MNVKVLLRLVAYRSTRSSQYCHKILRVIMLQLHLCVCLRECSTCQALIRELMYKCMSRFSRVVNSIIHANQTRAAHVLLWKCGLFVLPDTDGARNMNRLSEMN